MPSPWPGKHLRKALKRRSAREVIRKHLDDLLRPWVFNRAKLKCEKCHARQGAFKANLDGRTILQVAHFKSRRIEATRWDPDNVAALCKGCHFLWAHSEPDDFRDWWLARVGAAALARLNLLWHTPRRMDLAAVEVYLVNLNKGGRA